MNYTLPTNSDERKEYPIYEGAVAYFPAALAGVAKHSKEGNDKHNPGEPMHHARGKSSDHKDCIVRHLIDLGDLLAYFERHAPDHSGIEEFILAEADALAWRALALSQELHEDFDAPLAPNARLPAMAKTPSDPPRDWASRVIEACYVGWPTLRCASCGAVHGEPHRGYCIYRLKAERDALEAASGRPRFSGYPAERCMACGVIRGHEHERRCPHA